MTEPPLRRAVRALMLDPTDRILLMHLEVVRSGWAGWVLPGGGIDDGEELDAGLRREIHEETGLTEVFVGPIVCERRQYGERIAPGFAGQHDTIFLVPCRGFEPHGALAQEQLHAEGLRGSRWWNLDELRATDETVVPENLVELVERVLEFGGSVEPLTLDVREQDGH